MPFKLLSKNHRLLISEAIVDSDTGRSYLDTPGIWTRTSLRATVDVVHAKGGALYLQIWLSSVYVGIWIPLEYGQELA
ncbi:hypothetical protein TIFTF001_049306 [Ficus carica]|uniref:Uncharacterized protein n=1 Tax=Ficus carica TaxID=3494 RepID=A0AA87Z196_FICCA|nr:hypothetical protein TIFTF001_049306 [Ficus carica]